MLRFFIVRIYIYLEASMRYDRDEAIFYRVSALGVCGLSFFRKGGL